MNKFKTVCLLLGLFSILSGEIKLYAAAKYDIKQMTPQVEQALEARRGRFDKLKEFKKQGIVGENNRGYVEVLGGGGEAAGLVAQENRDRKVIYQAIAEQNGLQSQLDVIEKVFAQVQREKAQPGEKIQSEDGHWTGK
jgi:uncharacterized protein